jgi:hypothetical protein
MKKKQLRWEVRQWATWEIKDSIFELLKRGFIYEAAIVQDELKRIQHGVQLSLRHGIRPDGTF